MSNPFVHIELSTGDLDAARAFYKKLFDWKLLDIQMPSGVYTLIDPGKGPGGGMQFSMMSDAPPMWLTYVEVANVRRAIAKARKLGAKIVADFMDLGPNGTAGIFVDPTGAVLGVWAPPKQPSPIKRAAKKVAKRATGAAKKAATGAKKVAKTAKKTVKRSPR
ncbi:MAG: VOC family protein [Myxococcales bacterium]|jgi:predicted enzyme related to lactoylglutathione lyase